MAVLLLTSCCPLPASSENRTTNQTGSAEAEALTGYHRFASRDNNITILHEVHEDEEGVATEEPPLTLNTHEVLPLKPLKKKPYLPLEKILPSIEYVKPHPLKDYELHPVTFDFNLGDLEDLEHEVIKKGDLSSQEQHVVLAGSPELSYSPSASPDENDTVDVDIAELSEPHSTEPTTATSPGTTTTTEPTAAPTTPSTHILKILRSKPQLAPKLGRDLLKQSDDDMQLKTLGSTINSISRYLGANATGNGNGSSMAESLYGQANYFQIVSNLYDHFYWQISEIRTSVRTGCGLEMQAYLTALHSSYEWAQKGESWIDFPLVPFLIFLSSL